MKKTLSILLVAAFALSGCSMLPKEMQVLNPFEILGDPTPAIVYPATGLNLNDKEFKKFLYDDDTNMCVRAYRVTGSATNRLRGTLNDREFKKFMYDDNTNIAIRVILQDDVSDAAISNNTLRIGTNDELIIDNAFTATNLEVQSLRANGFATTNDTTISFVNSNRVCSITPTGADFAYWYQGIVTTGATTKTTPIVDADGLHYVYINSSGILTSQLNMAIVDFIKTETAVALVYWDSDNSNQLYFGDERHGINMTSASHLHDHEQLGTTYRSGLALSNFDSDGSGNDNSAARFSVAAGVILDEDLDHTTAAWTTNRVWSVYYYTNNVWRVQTNSAPVVGNNIGTERIAYNDVTAGNLTEVANNTFVLTHIFANNDPARQVVAIAGQASYINILSARQAAPDEISTILTTGLPMAEASAIGSIIYQTSDGYGNTWKARVRVTDEGDDYVDFRTSKLTPGASPVSHSDLADLDSDDHQQYSPTSGVRSFKRIHNNGPFTNDGVAIIQSTNVTELLADIILTTGQNARVEFFNDFTGPSNQFSTMVYMTNATFRGWVAMSGNDISNALSIYIQDSLHHQGDTNTSIQFAEDRIRFFAGGIPLLDIRETAQNYAALGNASSDIDVSLLSSGGSVYLVGSNGNVGIGIYPTNFPFEVRNYAKFYSTVNATNVQENGTNLLKLIWANTLTNGQQDTAISNNTDWAKLWEDSMIFVNPTNGYYGFHRPASAVTVLDVRVQGGNNSSTGWVNIVKKDLTNMWSNVSAMNINIILDRTNRADTTWTDATISTNEEWGVQIGSMSVFLDTNSIKINLVGAYD